MRNALGRLEQDGLVRIKPQSGTIVSEISIQKALHICEIRLLLERYAIYIAAQTVTDGQLAQLQRWFDRLGSWRTPPPRITPCSFPRWTTSSTR